MIDYKIKKEIFIDKQLLNSLDSQISNNSKPKTNMNIISKNTNQEYFDLNASTAKIFEMNAGAISESVMIRDEVNSCFSYNEYKSKKSIIIITDNYNTDELINIETHLNNDLHTIVYCGSHRNRLAEVFKKIKAIISTDSLTNAVTKAYQLVKEGQTIIFPKVDNKFEFFAHIELT